MLLVVYILPGANKNISLIYKALGGYGTEAYHTCTVLQYVHRQRLSSNIIIQHVAKNGLKLDAILK